MDRLLAAIRAGGFDADAAYHVYHLLGSYIFGSALWEVAYASLPSAST